MLGAQAIRPKRILKPDPPKPAEVRPKTPEEIAEEEAKQRAIARSKKIASLYQRSVSLALEDNNKRLRNAKLFMSWG